MNKPIYLELFDLDIEEYFNMRQLLRDQSYINVYKFEN